MAAVNDDVREAGASPVSPGTFLLAASSMLALGFALGFRRSAVRKAKPTVARPQHRPELLYGSEGVGVDRLEEVAEKADVTLAAKALVLGTAAALSVFGFACGTTCYALEIKNVCFMLKVYIVSLLCTISLSFAFSNTTFSSRIQVREFRPAVQTALRRQLEPVKQYLGTTSSSASNSSPGEHASTQ